MIHQKKSETLKEIVSLANFVTVSSSVDRPLGLRTIHCSYRPCNSLPGGGTGRITWRHNFSALSKDAKRGRNTVGKRAEVSSYVARCSSL